MSDALRPLHRPRLYEQLVERLREYVHEAGLKAGDRLPSERELAHRLGVSRNTLKQATVALEVQGMVEIRHGGGTYLRRRDLSAEPLDTLLQRRQLLPDILDTRDAVEPKLAALAARRRTDADLARLASALAVMADEVGAGGLGEDGDRLFHLAVSAAAHSQILAEFYRRLAPQLTASRRESLRQPGRPSSSLTQHRQIFDAISDADPLRAAEAAREHVRTVSRVRLLSWEP
jgi:GntR family transcriptional regulator, transcriptional repressor for pyruvate dehydrogenase complex